MLKATFLTCAMLLFTTSAQAQSCESYIGQTFTPKTFDQALVSVNAPAPKGEFETTAAYQARIAGSGGNGPLIVSKRPEDPKYLEYDADRGSFRVLSYLFDNTNFPAWETFYHAKVGIGASTMSNRDVVISQTEVVTGSYVGQNSYGAKANITKITRTIKAIYESQGTYSQGLFLNETGGEIGRIPMDVSQAMTFKQSARIAFVVVPQSPYIARASFSYGETTVSNPTDMTVSTTALIADIQCGLLMDGANKVVGAFAAR